MTLEDIVGESMAMRDVRRLIRLIASRRSTVFIRGETGTGKELAARVIHHCSQRTSCPFVTVDLAETPAALQDVVLFGCEKDAIAGNREFRAGRLELADRGTLFIDNIDEASLEIQAKLLRFLQEREFQRTGGLHAIRVDVRVIAATGRDMTALIREGRYSESLFYRLSVVPINLPPLRERREDIPDLVRHFVRCFSQHNQSITSIAPETLALLAHYGWPGNVRELRAVIERAVAFSEGPLLRIPADEIALRPAAGGKVIDARDQSFSIAFDTALSAGQITATLTALARYYRACGGVGLPVDFEDQEAVTEVVHA